jgi:hypothetical protein
MRIGAGGLIVPVRDFVFIATDHSSRQKPGQAKMLLLDKKEH